MKSNCSCSVYVCLFLYRLYSVNFNFTTNICKMDHFCYSNDARIQVDQLSTETTQQSYERWVINTCIWRAHFQNFLHPVLTCYSFEALRSQQTNFQYKIHYKWQMLILIEVWNTWYQQIKNYIIIRISGSIIQYLQTKKNKGIKSCWVPKPLTSTCGCHTFTLSFTLWNTSNESYPQ